MRKKSHENENFLDFGRIQQKMQTREKLLLAANQMMIEGAAINITAVAKRADVSKATAYRYFSSKEVLQREAALHTKSEDKENLFAGISNDDLEQRLDKLIQYHYEILTQNEAEFRLFLSAVLKDSVQNKANYSRAGRRILLIEEALKPLKQTVSEEEFGRMVGAISTILGIESITVLKDLSHLGNEKILDVWTWMIKKIVQV
ncbi:hypothetical protein BKI52_11385 [marine bacterium AO1-C]|nr:hypothetical protein BKI52_11385 [marine bacterium AO1-C]